MILWTCREGQLLQAALGACEQWGLTFDAVNESLPEWIEIFGTTPRKVGASEYWDDKAVQMPAPQENEPLTLEDLKEMNGEPVWREKPGHDGRWVLVDCFWSREGVVYLRNIGGSSELAETALKEGVKVYRHKLEG